MGWFDRFIGNLGYIGNDAAEADSKILEDWKKYLNSVPEKEKIIHATIVDVARLKELLMTELVDLGEDEKAEIEVIKDLDSVSHNHRIRSAHRLTQTLIMRKGSMIMFIHLLSKFILSLKESFIWLLPWASREVISQN